MKRMGLAISDPLGMIANGLDTVESRLLIQRLKEIKGDQGIESIVIGEPKRMSGEASAIESNILELIKQLNELFPEVKIERYDERFTSKIAFQTLIDSGISKKKRGQKETTDKVSAIIILQDYLNSKR